MKKVAIMQSNYIPWKGYFDMINMVDEFILFDSVQYTKRNWRNRNYIKTKNGLNAISIPVLTKNNFLQNIKDVQTVDDYWRKKHFKNISLAYKKSKFYNDVKDFFENLYFSDNETNLSKINKNFIQKICSFLDIKTTIKFDYEYKCKQDNDSLGYIVKLLQATKADIFLNGPTAKAYMNRSIFEPYNIKLFWMDYSNYPEYKQLYPPFVHQVSIIDLIFNEGKNAKNFMKSFKDDSL